MSRGDRIARPDHSDADWLRAVVDTAVDGVILIDARGGILMFNPACEKLFGYPADEVVGLNVKVLMPTSYREAHDGYLHNYHVSGERKIIGIGREVVGQRKDGSTFLMHLSVGETRQATGESIFVGVVHDLTERERIERELRESAARLRAVVDTAVDGCSIRLAPTPARASSTWMPCFCSSATGPMPLRISRAGVCSAPELTITWLAVNSCSGPPSLGRTTAPVMRLPSATSRSA